MPEYLSPATYSRGAVSSVAAPSVGGVNPSAMYNFSALGETSTEPLAQPSNLSGLIKLLILIFLPLGITTIVGMTVLSQNQEDTYEKNRSVVMTVPMKDVAWQDLGNVFEPVLTLSVKSQNGYEPWEFLIDSGAVISSLPREWAEKMGKDLAFMKRSTFKGFGGKTSFAYQDEMTILLKDQEQSIPVVFTEASGTKSLLGRKGFFEQFSVVFNHKERRIEIRK